MTITSIVHEDNIICVAVLLLFFIIINFSISHLVFCVGGVVCFFLVPDSENMLLGLKIVVASVVQC